MKLTKGQGLKVEGQGQIYSVIFNNNNNFICIAHQITYCLMALNNASKQYKKQG